MKTRQKKMLLGMLPAILAVTMASCGQAQPASSPAQSGTSQGGGSQPTSQGGTSGPSSQPGPSSQSAAPTSSEELVVDEEYEKWTAEWSQSGHLYIHYLRPDAAASDYERYCLWVWQHAPQDLEGTLWGFGSNPQVSEKLTLHPMSNHWMTGTEVGKQETGAWVDDYGEIIDINLKASNLVGGKSGLPVSFDGATNIGFLIVNENSMDGTTNWSSDSGKETYIQHFDQHVREDGSVHIFAVSGDLKNFSFHPETKAIRVNPVTKDTSGAYSSKTQTIVDGLGNPTTSTSDEFKSLGVGYQVFVPSFRDSNGDGLGDLRGVIDSLDYLEDLGAQVLWLTPIQQSDSYHGYDISDYFAVDPKFGTTDDYRELIYKAHQKGMKVLMDLVLNHTSKNNVWFEKSQWAVNSPNAEADETGIEWRNVYSWKYATDKIQKYIDGAYRTITVKEDAESKNPSWYRDGESSYYYYGKFGSGMPEINYEYQPTRELVKDMAKYWLSFGLDGFRLDAVKHIYMKDEVADTGSDIIITDTGTKSAYDDERGIYVEKDFDYSSDLNKNVTWWKEFAADLKGVFPNCFLVGENFDGWGARMAPYYQALDSQFDFANYYHICQYLYANPEHYNLAQQNNGGASGYTYNEPKETFDTFKDMSDRVELKMSDTESIYVPGGKRPDFINGAFTSNHDVPRAINQVNGTWAGRTDTTASPKITGTAQQIGRAKVHAALTMLLPGVSWIYYGDELGMSGNTDTHKTIYGNENSMDIWYRQPMKWGDDAAVAGTTGYKAGQYTFEWDAYNANLPGVSSQQTNSSSMYAWYKALNEIKRQYPKNAQVTMEGAKDIIRLDIKGDSGNEFRIFINCGYLDTEEYGVNPGGFTQVESPVLANGATAQTFNSTSYSVLVYKK